MVPTLWNGAETHHKVLPTSVLCSANPGSRAIMPQQLTSLCPSPCPREFEKGLCGPSRSRGRPTPGPDSFWYGVRSLLCWGWDASSLRLRRSVWGDGLGSSSRRLKGQAGWPRLRPRAWAPSKLRDSQVAEASAHVSRLRIGLLFVCATHANPLLFIPPAGSLLPGGDGLHATPGPVRSHPPGHFGPGGPWQGPQEGGSRPFSSPGAGGLLC